MDFNKMVRSRLAKIDSTLISKGKEYGLNGNRFHNFDIAAGRRGITPEKALDGMMLKHEVSVHDMINDPDIVTEAMIDEKIGDNIVYLILLEGLFRRRLEEKNKYTPNINTKRTCPDCGFILIPMGGTEPLTKCPNCGKEL